MEEVTPRKRRPGESHRDYRRSLALKERSGKRKSAKIITMESALEDAQARHRVEGTTIGMWRCACESYAFKLYEDGLVQCAECDKVSPQMICGLKERDGG